MLASGISAADRSEVYDYDMLDRLTGMDRGTLNEGKTAIAGTPAREETWNLNQTGNWAEYDVTENGAPVLNQTRENNKANEITGIETPPEQTQWAEPQYDARGNMITVPKPASPASAFACVWDAWNRLVEVKDESTGAIVVTYRYDAIGRRIAKLLGTDPENPDSTYDFYYNRAWQILEVRKDGIATENLHEQYVWSRRYIDAPVLRDRDTDDDGTMDETLHYANDANMNVTALIGTDGTVLERYAYDPYGKPSFFDGNWQLRAASAYVNNILYCGYFSDSETGFYDVRHRCLHPTLGLWLSRDPGGYGDGLGLYEYVGGAPTFRRDPLGLWEGYNPFSGTYNPPNPIPSSSSRHEFEPPEKSIQDPAVSQSELIKIDGGQPRALYPELPCGAARHYVLFEMLVEASGAFIQHIRFEVFKVEDCEGNNLWGDATSEEHWESSEVHRGNIHTGRAGFVSWLFDFVRAKRLEGTDKFEIGNNKDCTRGHWRLTGTSKFIPDYEISSAHWAEWGPRSPTMPNRTDQPRGWSDEGGLVHIMDVEWDCCARPRTMNINVQPGVSVMISR